MSDELQKQTIQVQLGEVVWGWKDIARVLNCSVDKAQRLATRDHDALPLIHELGKVGAFVQALYGFRANNRSSYKIYREVRQLKAALRRATGKRQRSAASSGARIKSTG